MPAYSATAIYKKDDTQHLDSRAESLAQLYQKFPAAILARWWKCRVIFKVMTFEYAGVPKLTLRISPRALESLRL